MSEPVLIEMEKVLLPPPVGIVTVIAVNDEADGLPVRIVDSTAF
jgi:hypothetical protein